MMMMILAWTVTRPGCKSSVYSRYVIGLIFRLDREGSLVSSLSYDRYLFAKFRRASGVALASVLVGLVIWLNILMKVIHCIVGLRMAV